MDAAFFVPFFSSFSAVTSRDIRHSSGLNYITMSLAKRLFPQVTKKPSL
jgi:hypothetical protein